MIVHIVFALGPITSRTIAHLLMTWQDPAARIGPNRITRLFGDVHGAPQQECEAAVEFERHPHGSLGPSSDLGQGFLITHVRHNTQGYEFWTKEISHDRESEVRSLTSYASDTKTDIHHRP